MMDVQKQHPAGFIKETWNHSDRRQRAWLIARAAVYIAMIVVMFTSEEVYKNTSAEGVKTIAYVRIVLVFVLAFAGVFLPFFLQWRRWPERFSRFKISMVYILLILVGLFITLLMCEYVHGFNFLEIRKKFIFFNALLAGCIYLVMHVITNRVKWSLMLTYALIIVASCINYYVNIFRGEAVSAADIFVVGTALNVAGNYTFAFTLNIFRCLLVGAVLFTIVTWMPKEDMYLRKYMRIGYDVIALALVVFTVWLFAASDWPNSQQVKVRVFKPMKTYKKNGELLNFVRGFYFMLVETPEGYTTEQCEQLMHQLDLESDPADYDDGKKNPNIIFIMNESLTDFSQFEDAELSEDPMPYIHSLEGQSNVILGNLHVDVFGGRTANTEYEVQTGNALYYMPSSAVPYAMYVRKPQPALTWNMIDMGYSGDEAFHPYHANGYSRPRAYPNLGFQRFVAIEDIESELTPEDYIRGWVSDATDFRYITKLYEEAKQKDSDAPYYLYNITMQNHGGYTEDWDNFEQDIEINGAAYQGMEALADTKRFINLTQYSDEAFHELTDYFEKVDEPTILIMYGDHLPHFYNNFYKTAWADADAKEKMAKYTTPLIIWANYDINANGHNDKIFDDISVNYLSAEIMKLAGLPMTAYQKYLVDIQEDLPVLTAFGILDQDGNYYEPNLDPSEYPFEEIIREYNYLIYNYQFDTDNRNDDFFTLKSDHSSLKAYEKEQAAGGS